MRFTNNGVFWTQRAKQLKALRGSRTRYLKQYLFQMARQAYSSKDIKMTKRYCFNYYLDDDSTVQPAIYIVIELESIFKQSSAVCAVTANSGRPNWFVNTSSFNHRRMREGDFRAYGLITELEAVRCAERLGLSLTLGQEYALSDLRQRLGREPTLVDRSTAILTKISEVDRRFIDEVSLIG